MTRVTDQRIGTAAERAAEMGETMMTGSGPFRLELHGVTKAFPGVLANDHVSFAVRPGEIHALLGENGAGKSTLVKMIYGVQHPDEGEIRFDGAAVRSRTPGRRGRWASAWCSSTSRCSRR